jgi:hypothetical protein
LAAVKEPVTATEMAKRFARAGAADVGEILETLCAMGKAPTWGPPAYQAPALCAADCECCPFHSTKDSGQCKLDPHVPKPH